MRDFVKMLVFGVLFVYAMATINDHLYPESKPNPMDRQIKRHQNRLESHLLPHTD